LARLRKALIENGRLSATLLEETRGVPSTSLCVNRFGSLRNTFKLIGYQSRRNCDYIDSRASLEAKLLEQASDIAERMNKLGAETVFDEVTHAMTLDGRLAVSFRIARYHRPEGKTPVWHIFRRSRLPSA
jgi:hypothetical protein